MIEKISEHSPPPPIAPQPSSWGRRALGHVWFILTFIPVQIFSLLVKIKDIFLCCSFAEAEGSQEEHKIMATKEPVPPTVTFPLKEEERSKVVATDSLPNLRYVMTPPPSRKVEETEPDLDLASLFVENEQPTSNQAQGKEVVQEKEMETAPQPASKEVLEASQQVTEVEVVSKPKTPEKIDVPDDGNCLFYACAVAIRKKYRDIPAIQEKLAWEVDPSKLTGDLSKQADLLEKPAALLRQQGADFLTKNQGNEQVIIALLSVIYEHNPIVHCRIQDLESLQMILTLDIETLRTMPRTKDIESQLKQKIEQLKATQHNIEMEKKNLIDIEEDVSSYIEKSKQDHFYCSEAHIYALSYFYDISITVLLKYGQEDQTAVTYNPEATQALTPITIAHVNNNHYVCIDT